MLLLGIDALPLGPVPVAPGGEWRGADLAAGTHGPSMTGVVVRLPETPGWRSRQLALPDRDHWLDADVLDPALAPRRRPLVHLHGRGCA